MLLSKYTLKNMTLKNRVVMAPMCMFCAEDNGLVTDWHIDHYATRAAGQVGLIIVEATSVLPEGRISDNDLGIWSDDHISGLKKIVDRVHSYGTKVGIQLAHAGRKSTSKSCPHVSVTEEPFSDEYEKPNKLDSDQIEKVALAFRNGARRALEAGFDFIEIHAAHGYLLSIFLSPISNTRNDEWGGSKEARFEFPRLVIEKIREVWADEKPLGIRISASDHLDNGISKQDLDYIASEGKALGVDIFNVSSGGVVSAPINIYPGYQIGLAEMIRRENNVPVIAGGLIDSVDMATEIIESGRADLLYLGRALLRNPYWVMDAANKLGVEDVVQSQYLRAYK